MAIDRFRARRRAMTERGERHPERDIADADVEAFILDAVDRLTRLPAARPESRLIPVDHEASEDEVYRHLRSPLNAPHLPFAEVGSQVIERLQAGRSALPRGGQELRVDVKRSLGQIRQGTGGNREQVDESEGRSHRARVNVRATEVARRPCIAGEQRRIDIALQEPRLDGCPRYVSVGACVHDFRTASWSSG